MMKISDLEKKRRKKKIQELPWLIAFPLLRLSQFTAVQSFAFEFALIPGEMNIYYNVILILGPISMVVVEYSPLINPSVFNELLKIIALQTQQQMSSI